jgi:hypothetical protein
MTSKVVALKEYFDSLGVVCPNPTEWMALADIIGTNMGGHHANPLILAGWNFTDDEQKRNRVRHQIDYAETLGEATFEKFEDYLRSIPKAGWYR